MQSNPKNVPSSSSTSGNSIAHSNAFLYRLFQMVRTTILVFIGELFFRANGLKAGLSMFKNMIINFSFAQIKNGKILEMGIEKTDLVLVLIITFIIYIISVLKERKINVREFIANKNIVIRWSLYYLLIISIILFGTYGIGIVHLDPIYANF